jgi:hypothetical protein
MGIAIAVVDEATAGVERVAARAAEALGVGRDSPDPQDGPQRDDEELAFHQ